MTPILRPLVALRDARVRAGFTQAELAGELGITRLAVLNIEVGRRNAGAVLMRKWARALKPHARMDMFDPDWLPPQKRPPKRAQPQSSEAA